MKKWWPVLLPVGIALAAFVFRIWGVSENFWMLEDQRRDWEIALGPPWTFPLVGSPTHVHGYTIGPAFYWILWVIRLIVGPFVQNLPHGGGIAQAFLESAADALLMTAIWRRTGSPWVALVAGVLMISSPFDLSLAAMVWNPTMGATMIKATIALVLLEWHRRSNVTLALTAALAWASIHVYTGAVFAALAALALMVWAHDWRTLRARAAVVGAVVVVLQLPYLAYRIVHRGDAVMSAVSGGIGAIARGEARLNLDGSARGYAEFMGWFQQFENWRWSGVVLVAGAVALGWRYRRDPAVIWIVLAPQLLAITGFALFLGTLDSYYYLSLLPLSVMTVVLGFLPRSGRAATAFGVIALTACANLVPDRLRDGHMFRMPEYGVLVTGSRTLVARNEPLRAIQTSFTLPANVNPGFPYFCMGGPFDRNSPLVAIINADGSVSYNVPR